MISASPLDAAVCQFDNLCAVFQGGEAMGNDKDGKLVTKAFDGLHDGLFGERMIKVRWSSSAFRKSGIRRSVAQSPPPMTFPARALARLTPACSKKERR